ncbi:hypothetical protein ACIHQR_10820 [Corallococcus coralloides]|uniref:hypothetical protein n=1 Tax=Corallococcus coralloides TaxID=184914 RepID=UPI00384E96BD
MSRDNSFAVGAVRTSRLLVVLFAATFAAGCGDDEDDCVPRTCESRGFNCGEATDGCGHTLDCGTCAAPSSCGGGGADNVCGCPDLKTACSPGVECGTEPDGCGGTVTCGTCAAPEVCGGRGVEKTCGVPAENRECSDGWCWEYPLPHGYGFKGAHFSSANDGWAVGEDGFIQHWDGARWTRVASGTLTPLHDVHALSPTDVWAVGAGGTVLHSTTGGAFSPVSSGTTRDLNSVWAAGPGDIWAVGAGGTVRRDRGSGFQGVDAATTKDLNGVWGSGPSDVWMVGRSGTLRRYDGSAVAGIDAGTTDIDFHEVTGTGPNDVWTVASDDPCILCDDYGQVFRTTPAGIEQSLRSSDQLFSVYAASPSLVLAGGEDFGYVYNGTKWTDTDEDAVGPITGSGPDNVWSFGPGGQVQKWSGQAWTSQAPLRTLRVARAIHGTGPSDVWAVGDPGRVLHWNGGGWIEPPLDFSPFDDVTGVYAASTADVWLTSSFHDRIYRFDGARFVTQYTAESSQALYAIHGASATDIWAVGASGQAVHFDGTSWTRKATEVQVTLNAVWVQGALLAIAVGDAGTILRWDGAAWSAMTSGTNKALKAVWGSGPSDVWAAGADGTLLRYSGGAWLPVASGTSSQLNGLMGRSATEVWAVGDNGTLLHFDGGRWTAETTGTRRVLRAVWAPSSSELWLVGDSAVLHKP